MVVIFISYVLWWGQQLYFVLIEYVFYTVLYAIVW